jgi:putative CocE/NonD family hydrolase
MKKFWKLLLRLVGGLIALIAIVIAALALSRPLRDWTATSLIWSLAISDRLADAPTRTEAQDVRRVSVRMRDGVELNTQVYLPRGQGPWPVILVRDPYGFAQYISCAVFVRYDYACVYQEVRGRGDSHGTWYPFIDERRDGLDTIAWILEQPWQNGRLALQGGSYVGIVQWAVAGDLPPQVKTFVPTVAHGDMYAVSYHNGMFNEGVTGVWLHSQFQPITRMFSAGERWRTEIAGHFPALGVDSSEFRTAWTPYRDYLLHPDRDDPYWQSPQYVALREAHRNVHVPVFMIGYASDFFLPGMLRTHEELPTRDQSVFIIGPGNHGGQADPQVEGSYTRDYADTLAWFDHHLRGAPLPEHLRPGVKVFVHGDNSWRHFERWPQPSPSLIYQLDNLSNAQQCDGGALTTDASASEQVARFTYDPRNPVPTRGGAFLLLSDTVEEQGNDICERADVLSFSSAPLSADTLVNGGMRVRLLVSSDAEDTAFSVKVSEHFKDGRVYNIRDDISTLSMRNGARRRTAYVPGEQVEVVFDLTPIMWRLREGSRLRLDVSSSSAPAFFPHPNRAGLWSEVADPVIAQQAIFGGSVEIPVDDAGARGAAASSELEID